MKTMVRVPYCRARSASAITCLISLIPASTAENSMNSALVMRAMICASVVLPVPGGPQKIREPRSSRSIWVRSGLPGPTRCSWPTNSSSVRGRMRSASGRVRSPGLSPLGMVGNRLMQTNSPQRRRDTETQRKGGNSLKNSPDYALCQQRHVEVDQKADSLTCQSQVGQALHLVDWQKLFDRFQFHNDFVLHDQVELVTAVQL